MWGGGGGRGGGFLEHKKECAACLIAYKKVFCLFVFTPKRRIKFEARMLPLPGP